MDQRPVLTKITSVLSLSLNLIKKSRILKWGHDYDNALFQLSVSGNSSERLHCGNVVNMPY